MESITLVPLTLPTGVYLQEVKNGVVLRVHGPLKNKQAIALDTRYEKEETKSDAKRLRKTATQQEDRIARDIGGRRQPASGALDAFKGDVRKVGIHRIEAKFTYSKSYKLERSTLEKIEYEASPGELPCVVIDFMEKRTRTRSMSLVVLRYETWLQKVGEIDKIE